jgi:hypothetical protein
MDCSHKESISTDLDLAYQFVREIPEDFQTQSRYHAVFFRSKFFLPCLIDSIQNDNYTPLRLYHENKAFFVTFDHLNKAIEWLKADVSYVKFIELSGEELIQRLSPYHYLIINPGAAHFFEMNPSHINYLKRLLLEISEKNNEKG